MFAGMLISTVGASMIWPFLMIYASGKLHLPLTAAASLMTLNAAAGLVFSFVAGPLVDRVGRKWVMVLSLVVNGVGYLLLGQANSLPSFAAVMLLQGAINPLYRVGADAMMADLIPGDQRIQAYSLMRLSNNIGVAVGPAVGGFIASRSYTVAFYCAAVGLITYGLLMLFFSHETLPQARPAGASLPLRDQGYGKVLADRSFLVFCLGFTLCQFCSALVWVLLGVYVKTNFGLSEALYGWLPTTNALMVVSMQLLITRLIARRRPLWMMAVGTLIYALATASVAFGRGFWWFWASMVVMTLGEMIVVPTSSTYTANRAPADMRGRYMSIYGLSWGVATGIAPVLGGFLNDNLSPRATWLGGAVFGVLGALLFVALSGLKKPRPEAG